MTTDFGQPISPPKGKQDRATSACEPYRAQIEQGLGRGRNAMAIWQDLVSDHGFPHGYQTVKRFVRKLRGWGSPHAVGIILTVSSITALYSNAGRGARGPSCRKPARKPRPDLWETSRKCSHGHVKEIFFELRGPYEVHVAFPFTFTNLRRYAHHRCRVNVHA